MLGDCIRNWLRHSCHGLMFAQAGTHLRLAATTLELIAMKRLNLLWRICAVFNGFTHFAAVEIMTNANDHESQLSLVANDCQSELTGLRHKISVRLVVAYVRRL